MPDYPKEIEDLIWATRDMPTETPGPGYGDTEHTFTIVAAHIWALDKALKEIDETKDCPGEIKALIKAAKKMPRESHGGGGEGTVHDYEIKAADIWALDAALRDIEQLEKDEG